MALQNEAEEAEMEGDYLEQAYVQAQRNDGRNSSAARNRNGHGEVLGSRAEKQLLLTMLENDKDDADQNQEDEVSQGSSLADELGDMAGDFEEDAGEDQEPEQVMESNESPEKQAPTAEGKQQFEDDENQIAEYFCDESPEKPGAETQQ